MELTLGAYGAMATQSISTEVGDMAEAMWEHRGYCFYSASPQHALRRLSRNVPLTDFVCLDAVCRVPQQVKAMTDGSDHRVLGGDFSAAMGAALLRLHPILVNVAYAPCADRATSPIRYIRATPGEYITPEIISQRPPCGPASAHPNLVQCIYDLTGIEEWIYVFRDGIWLPRPEVVGLWRDASRRARRQRKPGWWLRYLRVPEPS